ncbi:MAG: Asp-tRNA(Asn)/Glu-tRNA(Gln) amidotransferase subunit GatC [Candidatus Xenobia bacterium]
MEQAALTLEDVDKIAHLARLGLKPGERELYHKQLCSILEYVNTLQGLDTSGIEATFMVQPRHNVMRDDVVRPSIPVEAALANAPQREGDTFKVPRILDEE